MKLGPKNLMSRDEIKTPIDWRRSPRTWMKAALMLMCFWDDTESLLSLRPPWLWPWPPPWLCPWPRPQTPWRVSPKSMLKATAADATTSIVVSWISKSWSWILLIICCREYCSNIDKLCAHFVSVCLKVQKWTLKSLFTPPHDCIYGGKDSLSVIFLNFLFICLSFCLSVCLFVFLLVYLLKLIIATIIYWGTITVFLF